MVNPEAVLELLSELELTDPLDLSSLGAEEPLVRSDTVVALCEHFNQLGNTLPQAEDRELILMAIISRVVLENVRLNVKDLEETKAALAAQSILAKYRL